MIKNYEPSSRDKADNLKILRANLNVLSEGDQKFAHSLTSNAEIRGLTEKQWYWVDQLVSRALARVEDHGKRTGKCIYCRRKLTHNFSLQAGYGPICAEKYHLPWGEITHVTEENNHA